MDEDVGFDQLELAMSQLESDTDQEQGHLMAASSAVATLQASRIFILACIGVGCKNVGL